MTVKHGQIGQKVSNMVKKRAIDLLSVVGLIDNIISKGCKPFLEPKVIV